MPNRLLRFFFCTHGHEGHGALRPGSMAPPVINSAVAIPAIRAHFKYHANLAVMTGIVAATLAVGLLTLTHEMKNPEVSINRRQNPEPWNRYFTKQYKLLSSGRDYTVESPVPKY